MSYINLASANKSTRAASINTAIGTSGFLQIFTGVQPISPDLTASGTQLVSMPLSATAAVASTTLQSCAITAGGTGGTNGTQTVTLTTGTGTQATVSVTVSGNAITAILSVLTGGNYSVNPTALNAVPVTGASLTGATLNVNMTGLLTFNAITQTNAANTGTAGYARIVTSGGVGVVDLDCGTSGTSVVLNTTSIVAAGPVIATSCIFTEA